MDSTATPAPDYESALARLDALRARDAAPHIRADSGTAALLHGGRTARAVVLFHGLTNGPPQFAELGRRLHAAGYNVLIPRLPGHGHADRLTGALADLTVAALAERADEALAIAAGLGEEVALAGLSLGGALAGWLAQQRAEVARALLIAPLLGLYVVPPRLTGATVRLARRLPNRFLWWDPRVREAIGGPEHAYPRFATRALAVGLWFGLDLLRRAKEAPPAARSLAIVTAWGDRAVSPGAVDELARRWEGHGRAVARHHFGPEEVPDLLHDLIDPAQPDARIETVYPVLMRLLGVA